MKSNSVHQIQNVYIHLTTAKNLTRFFYLLIFLLFNAHGGLECDLLNFK